MTTNPAEERQLGPAAPVWRQLGHEPLTVGACRFCLGRGVVIHLGDSETSSVGGEPPCPACAGASAPGGTLG